MLAKMYPAAILAAGLLMAAVPAAAQPADIQIDLHIIGFGVSQSTADQLNAMAEAGNGRYYSSANEAELVAALGEAVGVSVAAPTALETSESEPNDSFGSADPIAPTSSFQGAIQAQNDSDWLRLTVDRQGALDVKTTAVPAELDIVFRLWNADKELVLDWQRPPAPGSQTAATFDLPAPGAYTLEVRDGGNSAHSPDAYGLDFVFTASADTGEPNDRFSLATPAAFGTPIQANILPQHDADWYVVEIDHQGALDVEIGPVPEALDAVFRVWDADKALVVDWQRPPRAGAHTIATVDLPAPGRYFVEVRDGGNSARATEPYTLTMQFTPTADAAEPNDRVTAATPAAFDTPIQAAILPQHDADWYRIEVAHQGELGVSITDVPQALDLVYRVWDVDVELVVDWQRPPAAGADTIGTVDLPAPGPYLLEVRDGGNSARAVEPYTLNLKFTPTPDADEPNDKVTGAGTLAIGTSTEAAILPQGDADWYRIDVPQQGALAVNVTDVPQALDIVFRVWDSDIELVVDWQRPPSAGADTLGVVDFRTSGVYFLEVRDGGNSARSVEPYTLATEFTPSVSDDEPNDTIEAAAALALGQPLQAGIFPRGDHDWFALDIAESGSLRVHIGAVPDNLDVVYRLWNADGAVVGGWYRPAQAGADTEGETAIPAAGRYFIEIADGGDNDRSTDPYTLEAVFTPESN